MAIALVSSVSGALGLNGGTSGAITTTGANLIVLSVSSSSNPPYTVSDSKGNTYTALPLSSLGTVYQRLWYVSNPVVGTGHTFTVTGTTISAAISVYAFSGAAGYAGIQNGATGTTSPGATGAVTPVANGSLILTGMSSNGAVVSAPPAGFTGFVHIPSGTSRQLASAYLIQATAATINPQWTWTGTVNVARAIAVFTPAAIAPTLTTITPDLGAQGTVVPVTLTGTGFVVGGTTILVSGPGITIASTVVSSATTLTATFTIAADAPPGARTVLVTTAGGTSDAVGFTVSIAGTSLTINGRETTETDLHAGSLRCEQILDARGKLACRLINPPVDPQMDETVLFTLDGVPFFGGVLVEVTRTDVGAWSLVASDNAVILDSLLINNISPAGTLKSVLEFFVDISLGLPYREFSIDPAQADGPTLPAIAWPMQTFSDAFKQLGTISGWTTVISPTRVMRMYPGGAVPAPWAVDLDTTQALTIRQSREGHASRVWVRFGSGAPSAITYATKGDGVAVSWEPPYAVATPPNVVIVNGVSLPVFPVPDPGWAWETTGSTGVLHAPTGDPPLTVADTISFTFLAAWPWYVHAEEAALVIVETIVDYPDVFDAAIAQSLAEGELLRRVGYPRTFQLRTHAVGLQPGQTAAIVLPSLDLDTEALVTGIRLQHTSTLRDGEPWWTFAVDLIEANASRTNWLTFWQESKPSSHTGTGSSGTGTIPPGPPPTGGGGGTAGYATWPLGGDHDAGYTGATWQPIANACLVVVPSSFTGRLWTVYATVKKLMGTGSFQLALANAAGTNIATSTATTADFASLVFSAPVTPGETYHLRGLPSDGTTLYGTTAYLEAVPV